MNYKEKNAEFKDYFESEMRKLFDRQLQLVDDRLKPFYDAIEYSVFSGGKRIRPMIMLDTYKEFGGTNEELILKFAYAIELIHTYSLVHDDLPAMDNDDYRRGKLSSHKKFGEDIAILVGDALLNMAFEQMLSTLSIDGANHTSILNALAEMASNSGAMGMVGGQAVEILLPNPTKEDVLYIENLKTSKLFVSSLVCAAILAEASEEEIAALRAYGENIGLAFQIKDDIMDLGSENKGMFSTNISGKQALEEANNLVKKAMLHIQSIPVDKQYYQALAEYMINRSN